MYHRLGLSDQQILWIEANPMLVQGDVVYGVISDKDNEQVIFYVANNGQSSSILPFKDHLKEHPSVVPISSMNLSTITLDTLFATRNIPYDQYDVMNLDIQGAELKALNGALHILPHIKSIYTEVNVKELYENNAMMDQLDAYLLPHGFTRVETSMKTMDGEMPSTFVHPFNV